MRLRLRIFRNDLPSVSTLWPVSDIALKQTFSELLKSINDTFPLEADQWGLEDYIVLVGDFECVHYHVVGAVCRDDDEVVIRPLLFAEKKARKATGRSQISGDGRHLVDGVPFGRPLLKANPTRPVVKIPARKTVRLLEAEAGSEGVIEVTDGQQSALKGREDWSQLQLVAMDDSQDEDDDYEDSESSSQTDSDSSEEEDADEPSAWPSNKISNGLMELSSSDSTSSDSESESESESESDMESESKSNSDADRSDRVSKKAAKQGVAADLNQKLPGGSETNASALPKSEVPKPLVKPGMGKKVTHSRNERKRLGKKLAFLQKNGILSPNARLTDCRDYEEAANAARHSVATTSGWDSTGSGSAYVQRGKCASLLDGSDEGAYIQGERAEFENQTGLQAGRTPESDSSSNSPNRRGRGGRLDRASAQRMIFGSLGIRVPKNQEERERMQARLASRRGVNHPSVQPVESAQTQLSTQEPTQDEQNGETSAWQAKINMRLKWQQSMQEESGDIEHRQGQPSAPRIESPQRQMPIQERIEEQYEKPVDSAQTQNSIQERRGGQIETPANPAQAQNYIQKQTEGQSEKAADSAQKRNAGQEQTEEQDENPDAWRAKINLTGVECCEEGVYLGEPPFPFVQRWDPQQRSKKRKRSTKSASSKRPKLGEAGYDNSGGLDHETDEYGEADGEADEDGHYGRDGDHGEYGGNGPHEGDGEDGDGLDYDGIHGSDEPLEQGRQSNGSVDDAFYENSPSEQLRSEAAECDTIKDDSFAPQHYTEECARENDIIKYTALACSAATRWEPKMLTQVARIYCRDGDKWVIQPWSRDSQELQYNEYGKRVYNHGLETEGNPEAFEEVTWAELGEVRLLERRLARGTAGQV